MTSAAAKRILLRDELMALGVLRGDLCEQQNAWRQEAGNALREAQHMPGLTMAEAADLLGLNSRTEGYRLLEGARRNGR